jgi:hypothetical protein
VSDERARNAYKRKWERENYRGECASCGGDTSRPAYDRCVRCERERVRQQRVERAERIADLWAQGMTIKQIAPEVGMTPGSLNIEMTRIRQDGLVDLPLRRRERPVAP